jgi:hypothetical protein
VVAFATVDLDITLPAENYNLVVQGSGDGQGTVTSSPDGIDCETGAGSGGNCSAAFANGAQVVLTATPAAGSVFDGWVGACSDAGTTCPVTLEADLTVTASFSNLCSQDDISISSPEASFGAEGGQGSFSVSAPNSCSWTVSTTDGWLSIDSSASGSGDGTVSYSVAANTDSPQRDGSINVGGVAYAVHQDPAICTFSISPTENLNAAAGGASYDVQVESLYGSCVWTTSESLPWVSLSPTGGTGDGSVTVTVLANSGDRREGTVQIAGQDHDVAQQAVPRPPTPDPMTWATEPHETSTTAIAMRASTASDPDTPVTYQFDFVDSTTDGGGANDSGWQSGTTYTDSGLGANHRYGYRVRARDSEGNATTYSSTSYDYTEIETPSGITFGTITTTSIQARSTNTPSGLARGGSGLIIYNVTRETDSTWRQNNNLWTSGSLAVNRRYGFNAQARNGDGNATGVSPTAYRYTLANVPGYAQFSNQTQTSIRANWTASGNPSGTAYQCHNITTDEYSGWITNTYWVNSGLTCSSRYAFEVRARNGDRVATAWRALDDTSTATCPPSEPQIDQSNLPAWEEAWTNIQPENEATQTFTPRLGTLTGVDIDIVTGNPQYGDDYVTVEIMRNATSLGSATRLVPVNSEGVLHFDFKSPISTDPGETLRLVVRDTTLTIGWKYGDNSYSGGIFIHQGVEFPNNDFFFRTWGY